MHSTTQPNRPKIAETVIHATANIRDSSIGRCCEILADTSLHGVQLGDFSYLGQRCIVGDAVIGKFCAIAAEVRIGAPNHPMDRPSMHRFTYCPEYYSAEAVRDHAVFGGPRAGRAIVGEGGWVGHGVIVLPGVQTGDGAALAAGAVGTKDVDPYTVAGGVPAKFIRERFTRAVAGKLVSIAWWDWPFETIMERLADFQSSDIDAFCERWS